MPKKNKVIGLIIEDLFTDFAKEITESARKAIPDKKNTRLMVISGKYDDGHGHGSMALYKSVYNTVYNLGAVCELDGLIIHLGSLDESKKALLEEGFFERYRQVPKVLIASRLEGYTTVGYDNRTGIREAIDCIVNVNGITEICMLGGRKDNYEACMRKQIFIDCLAEHAITFREEMFENTDMSTNTEEPAGKLLDRNPGVRAIFCVNDSVAVGLYKAMKKRRLVPGKDILVFGFDNTRMSSEMKPSLATIGADSVSIGQRAVELLLAKINGEEVRSELIPTKLYGRGSFEYSTYGYSMKDLTGADRFFIYRLFDDCFYRYGTGNSDRDSVDLRRLFYEIASRMLKAMNDRYLGHEDFEEIGRLIDIFFDEGAMNYTDTEKFLLSIKNLQESMAVVQNMRAAAVNSYINRLFLRMKDRAITVLAEKNINEIRKQTDGEEHLRGFLINASLPDLSGGEKRNVFGNIAMLGIDNAVVYMFEKPVVFRYEDTDDFPEHIRLVCAVKNGELYMLPKERSDCRLSAIMNRDELSSKCRAYAVFPVFFRRTIYGFFLSEVRDDIYTRGEYIAMQLGRAIYLSGSWSSEEFRSK